MTKSYPELTPYQFAHNRPIEFIDIDGLEGISINDEKGKQRAKTNYDETSDELLKGGIDNIANNDCVTICDITLQDIGPKEVIRNDDALREGVIKDVYHEYSYLYTGEDSEGNQVTGTGTLLQPVTSYKVGASFIDALIGGATTYAFAKIANIKLFNSSKQVTNSTKDVSLPKTGIPYFDKITDLSKINANQLVSYSRQLESLYKSGKIGALTRDQAALLTKHARRLGENARIDNGHSGTFWDMEHLNIGPSGYHVPITPRVP